MRILIIIVLVLLLLIGAAAIYLVSTTPESAEALSFPLPPDRLALLEGVPADADAFALIPAAALLRGKLLANAVTHEPLLRWEQEHEMPRAWMLGAADVVVWKREKATSYRVRLDGFRALVVRAWLAVASNAPARWEGSTLVMNDATPSPQAVELAPILRLAAGLPAGEALVVQMNRARGAFPPIGRPAVTSIRIAADEILLVSRAAADDASSFPAVQARFPRSAMLSVTFAKPPRIVSDLNRLLGTKIDRLVEQGGSITLYSVDAGTFIPRPKGVIVIPATDGSRSAMEDVISVARLVGETRDTGSEIQVAFDRTSLGTYAGDEMVPATWPATSWALRIDPPTLVPVLRKLSGSTGLRLLAPRMHRGARDLGHWIDALERADSVEAASSAANGVEELRVRVSAAK